MDRTMACPACGSANEQGRKFCGECGSPLSVACPTCGTPNAAGIKFCGECGTRLDPQAGPASAAEEAPPSPGAERRLVSVLFADLVGFTAASEGRDAEDTRELLTRYFDLARTTVERYGGTVEKFIGDAVMALWGAPVANEDDAERAVRAALELVASVPDLDGRLNARAGVLTGEAAVTVGAQGQGMVAGDLVNTASRIQSAAEPGTVLVGDATKRASEAAVAYEEAGERALKGKAEPVALWRAQRIVAARGGALRSSQLEPPFVGRERELRLVKDLFHATAEESKARLVSITGIAGIGKSRLAWEFFKYIDGLADSIWWWSGRCLAYGEGVAYWALAEMVRTRADIVEGEAPESARPKLRAALEPYIADPDERDWIEPRLAHLLGLEARAAEREDLFAAWRLYFERLSEHQPAVLVFEDMQWADVSLLEFVEYLLEWSRNHPLYVLTFARPDLMERHPSWGAGKRNFTALTLEPLSVQAMEELLDGFVPGLPDELRTQILVHAEGVPLYAVETVRMLLDRGLLERAGERYRPTGPIAALEVPETLHALLAARIDALEPEERRLLQDASVLGRTFTKQALAELSGTSEEELEPRLAALVRKEVLSLEADPRSPERGQYGFVQDLLRRVAYETLGRSERKARHLAAAAFLESGWGPAEQEIAEVISTHYLEAYRAAPAADDAGEIKGKAQTMLTRAAERAASLAASEEAQRYFEQAAELADEPLVQAKLLERAGEMAWARGHSEDAQARYERALALFEQQGTTHPAARVAARLGEVDWAGGRLDAAIERMERAFGVLSAEEPDEDLAALAAQLGRLLWFRGDIELATQRIDTALTIAESLRLPEVLSQALNTLSAIAMWRQHYEHALALVKHSLELALENDRPAAAMRAYNNLGELLGRRDRHEEALRQYDQGIALARKVGNRPWEFILLGESSYSLAMTGRWREALEIVDDMPRDSLQDLSLGAVSTSAPEVLRARGEIEEAESLVKAFERFQRAADVQERAGWNLAHAVVLQARGRHADALAAAEAAKAALPTLGAASQPVKHGFVEALDAALAVGDVGRAETLVGEIDAMPPGAQPPFLRAHAARFRARLAVARGEDDGIEPGFKQAESIFREFGIPFWLAVTQLEHGEWLTGSGRSDEAGVQLTQAREIFERLEAAPWLERLAAVRESAGART
ncbi:MAG: AAA family ATPase [Thermoleophilia bacterium]|nr:AAA family ATPase [Thermoleophilia bacterium]